MEAAYITELGSPDVITFGELPRPVPGPTDVLVRVEAVAVDPADLFVRSGAYRTPTPFPFVLGRDVVGTVAETGPGASGFAVGDRVWSHSMGHAGRQGVTAEYCVVGFAISNAGFDDLAATATVINHGLTDDAFPIPVTAELPMSRTAEAHRMLEAGSVRGRIVLRP